MTTSMQPRPRALLKRLADVWPEFSKACNGRWAGIDENLLRTKLTKKQILGSGYFGIVFSTNNKKLVLKITTDEAEGAFSQLILEDPELRYSKGLPYILDVIKVPDLDAYVILRENVYYGNVEMPKSSPFSRAVGVLDEYGEAYRRIDLNASKTINSLHAFGGKLTHAEFEHTIRSAQGLIRIEIIKSVKKLPTPSSRSKYRPALDMIKHSLEVYGVALWDLHPMNLGTHKYSMHEFDENIGELDKDAILVLDVGGNWGSPILDFSMETLDLS